MSNIPKKCPACNANLTITRLSCPDCGTEVTGSFSPDLFSRLSPNDYDFIVLFLKTKGNIKEMERELGISYWTIRTKLNEIVEQLGFEASEPAEIPSSRETELANRRQAILDQLNSGQLTVQEAAALLKQIKRRNR